MVIVHLYLPPTVIAITTRAQNVFVYTDAPGKLEKQLRTPKGLIEVALRLDLW